MKLPRRLKLLYKKQRGKCIWCGRQTWLRDTIKSMTDREVAEFLHVPYSKKHLATRIRKRFATIEHLIPRCSGGNNKALNLALACADCNSKRQHHGSSISYEVLGLFHYDKQRYILESRDFCNRQLKSKYRR